MRRLNLRRDLAHQIAEIEVFPAHLVAGHPGETQHVVDQLRHALAGGAHAAQIALTLSVELVAGVFKQRLTKTVDTPKRRP